MFCCIRPRLDSFKENEEEKKDNDDINYTKIVQEDMNHANCNSKSDQNTLENFSEQIETKPDDVSKNDLVEINDIGPVIVYNGVSKKVIHNENVAESFKENELTENRKESLEYENMKNIRKCSTNKETICEEDIKLIKKEGVKLDDGTKETEDCKIMLQNTPTILTDIEKNYKNIDTNAENINTDNSTTTLVTNTTDNKISDVMKNDNKIDDKSVDTVNKDEIVSLQSPVLSNAIIKLVEVVDLPIKEVDKEFEVYSKYVNRLEELSNIIENKYNFISGKDKCDTICTPTPADTDIIDNKDIIDNENINDMIMVKDLVIAEDTTPKGHTIKNNIIYMTGITNNNDVIVDDGEGESGKEKNVEVVGCLRSCAKVQCALQEVDIRDSKKISLILNSANEVTITDSEIVQIQVLKGLKKCTVINSADVIIFVDAHTLHNCQFFSTKSCNFNIIRTLDDNEEDDGHPREYTVPDQMMTSHTCDLQLNTTPFTFAC